MSYRLGVERKLSDRISKIYEDTRYTVRISKKMFGILRTRQEVRIPPYPICT